MYNATHLITRKGEIPPLSGDSDSQYRLYIGTVLILLCSLFRGGNRHAALLILELLSLGILVSFIFDHIQTKHSLVKLIYIPRITLQHICWVTVISSPLWIALWGNISLSVSGIGSSNSPTLVSAMLVGLPLVATLLLGRASSLRQVDFFVSAWLFVALGQAIIGLLQIAGFEFLRFDAVSNEPAIGTFASKNTYTNLLVMAIPLAALRLGAAIQKAAKASRRNAGGTTHFRAWFWTLAMLVLLAILLLGTSRTGIATGLLALVLSVPLLIWPRASQPGKATASRRWAMAGAAALLGLALLAAGWEWAARFEAGRLLADGATRALLRQTTWQAALAHWPWGTGMGSYASAYMPWQPAELGFRWVATAHNDYLQMLMELGLGAVLLAAALLWLVGQRLWLVWHQRQPRGQAQSDASTTGSRQARQLQGLQTAAGLGVMTIALHATVDYPFYIPANAMMGCFLLGVWLRPWPAQAGVTSRTEGGT